MIVVIPIPFIVITTIIPFWNTTVILNITMIMMILVWSVSLSLQTIVLYYIGVSIFVFRLNTPVIFPPFSLWGIPGMPQVAAAQK
jgi:hypothetical protein